MNAHNRRKVFVNGRYISRLEKLTLNSLTIAAGLTASALAIALSVGDMSARAEMASPLPENFVYIQQSVYEEHNVDPTSMYVDDALIEFVPARNRSEARMILHCLLHRESGHGASGKPTDVHGDGGLAGGPMQFHEATWNRMRKQMIAQGVATEIGSRYDLHEAIRTTTWAIQNGRAKEWGPIFRSSQGSTFAACQEPSWVK